MAFPWRQQHRLRTEWGWGQEEWPVPGWGETGDLPSGSQPTDQLTGRRGRPRSAWASSGWRGWRLGWVPPLGARAGWEPFQQLWPFLQGIYQTLQTKPGREPGLMGAQTALPAPRSPLTRAPGSLPGREQSDRPTATARGLCCLGTPDSPAGMGRGEVDNSDSSLPAAPVPHSRPALEAGRGAGGGPTETWQAPPLPPPGAGL